MYKRIIWLEVVVASLAYYSLRFDAKFLALMSV